MSGESSAAEDPWSTFPALLFAFDNAEESIEEKEQVSGHEHGAYKLSPTFNVFHQALSLAAASFSPRELFTICASVSNAAGPHARLKISALLATALRQIERKQALFLKDGLKVHVECFHNEFFPEYGGEGSVQSIATLPCIVALCRFITAYFDTTQAERCSLAGGLVKEEESAIALLTKIIGKNMVRREEDVFVPAVSVVLETFMKMPHFNKSPFQLVYNHRARGERVADAACTPFEEVSDVEEDSDDDMDFPTYDEAGVAAIMFHALSSIGGANGFDLVDPVFKVKAQLPLVRRLLRDRTCQLVSLRGIEYASLVFSLFGRQIISIDVFEGNDAVESVLQEMLSLTVTYPDNQNRTFTLSKVYSILECFLPEERIQTLSRLTAGCPYDHLAALLIDRIRKVSDILV